MMTDQPEKEAAKLSWGLKQSFRTYVEGAGTGASFTLVPRKRSDLRKRL